MPCASGKKLNGIEGGGMKQRVLSVLKFGFKGSYLGYLLFKSVAKQRFVA